MIAQIDAAAKRAENRIVDRQCPLNLDAGARHLMPVRGVDQAVRAQIVDQRSACDAPGSRALQGLGHFQAVSVGQPDVEGEMHVIFGRVDIGDHALDALVRAGHELGTVAADGAEAADALTRLEQWRPPFRDTRSPVSELDADAPGLRHGFLGDLQPPDVSVPDIGLTEERVGNDADDWNRQNDNDPGDARQRAAVLSQQDPQNQAALDGNMQKHSC